MTDAHVHIDAALRDKVKAFARERGQSLKSFAEGVLHNAMLPKRLEDLGPRKDWRKSPHWSRPPFWQGREP